MYGSCNNAIIYGRNDSVNNITKKHFKSGSTDIKNTRYQKVQFNKGVQREKY